MEKHKVFCAIYLCYSCMLYKVLKVTDIGQPKRFKYFKSYCSKKKKKIIGFFTIQNSVYTNIAVYSISSIKVFIFKI